MMENAERKNEDSREQVGYYFIEDLEHGAIAVPANAGNIDIWGRYFWLSII